MGHVRVTQVRSADGSRRPATWAVVAAAVGALLLAGCDSGSDGHTASTVPSVAPTASTPGAQATPTPTPSATPPAPTTLPDGSRRLFPGHRIVAFYGEPGAPTLGVLGTRTANGIWPRLDAQAQAYDVDAEKVLPAYEVITYVATGGAGHDGTYAFRIPDSTIDAYAAAAKRHHALLILDIQPGRGEFLPDAQALTRWLKLPDVALALDPEWKLHGHQKPDQQIGHTEAASINAVSAWLNQLTAAQRLPQKLLLIHQFTPDMIRNKSQVVSRQHLATVFNMDGFGNRADKLVKYRFLAQDKHFPIGMKLFYQSDTHIFTPARTLGLHPAPVVIDYE
jgi:hypothetical protein